MIFKFLLLCISLISVNAQFGCENVLTNTAFNSCRIQYPVGLWTSLASIVQQFTEPRTLLIVTVLLFLVLPLLLYGNTPAVHMVAFYTRRFHVVRINVLNFLHRLTYAVILCTGLHAAFRQSRPCRCPSGNRVEVIGSHYGMPSADAIVGAMLGSLLIDNGPYWAIGSRLIGALIMVWICMERIVLGYHSLGQMIVGTIFGILLHFYSTRAPQYMIFVDALVQTLVSVILVRSDDSLVFAPDDDDNLMSWIAWGFAFEMFACLLVWRHYSTTSMADVKKSLHAVNKVVFVPVFSSAMAGNGVQSSESSASEAEAVDTQHGDADAHVMENGRSSGAGHAGVHSTVHHRGGAVRPRKRAARRDRGTRQPQQLPSSDEDSEEEEARARGAGRVTAVTANVADGGGDVERIDVAARDGAATAADEANGGGGGNERSDVMMRDLHRRDVRPRADGGLVMAERARRRLPQVDFYKKHMLPESDMLYTLFSLLVLLLLLFVAECIRRYAWFASS